jgi:hypothetical protein
LASRHHVLALGPASELARCGYFLASAAPILSISSPPSFHDSSLSLIVLQYNILGTPFALGNAIAHVP